jgi:hypothetical protein
MSWNCCDNVMDDGGQVADVQVATSPKGEAADGDRVVDVPLDDGPAKKPTSSFNEYARLLA